jgi:hypothetical protein
MSRTYGVIDEYFDYKIIDRVDPETVWVEIGSERGEGSTINILAQAKKFGIVLHTVDVSSWCLENIQDPDLVCHVGTGSTWTKEVYPGIGKKISFLHLDNFDWNWKPERTPDWIQKQIDQYRNEFGLVMNNQRCQQEHLAQAVNLLPWLDHDCLVALDDTYLFRGVWTGKGGAVVPFLKIHGFRITHTNDSGTVLARGFDVIPEINTDDMIFP